MQRVAVLLIAIISLRCATINVQATPQRYMVGPAATLLLPYFEASGSLEYNTSLTITNTATTECLVRFTFWTDHGFPTFWFTDTIAARTTRGWSIGGILNGQYVLGAREGHPPCSGDMLPNLPDCAGSPVSGMALRDANCWFRGGVVPPCATPVSERHSRWIGYLTADVVSATSYLTPGERGYYLTMLNDNVLTGTFEQRGGGVVLAAGPLVHLAARSGLASTFYANFSHGDDHREADLHIWTEPPPASLRCDEVTRPVLTSRRIRPWRRQTTVRARHQTWVTISKPTAPDPSATTPPERCERIEF
jgi:hypothetical protein